METSSWVNNEVAPPIRTVCSGRVLLQEGVAKRAGHESEPQGARPGLSSRRWQMEALKGEETVAQLCQQSGQLKVERDFLWRRLAR